MIKTTITASVVSQPYLYNGRLSFEPSSMNDNAGVSDAIRQGGVRKKLAKR